MAPADRHIDKKVLARLLSYLKPYRLAMALVAVLVVFSSVSSVAGSVFLQPLIDNYITPMIGAAQPDYGPLVKALVVLAAILTASALTSWAYNWIMIYVAHTVLKKIRDEMFSKMQRLPIAYFDSHGHGDIMSLYTNDVDTLRQMLAQTFTELVSSILTLAAVFVSMLYMSVWLTAIVVIGMVVIILTAAAIAKSSAPWFTAQQKTLADVNSYVEEIINGQKVVKVFNYEGTATAQMRDRNSKWQEAATISNAKAMTMMPLMNGMGYLQYDIIAIGGALLAIAGAPNLSLHGWDVMSVGMIASFLTLSRNFTGPISRLSNQFNSVITALAGAGRIFELLDQAEEEDQGQVRLVNVCCEDDGSLTERPDCTGTWAWRRVKEDGSPDLRRLRGHVVMEHVDFGYQPDKTVLHDITLYAEPGQKVAFVGATGAGKTTITNLINRFYDISSGSITYDGIDIRRIRKQDLRQSLGMVLQEVNLFTGTVMENIRFGNPEATDEDCIRAAVLANADGFIRRLPQGYDTLLSGDGAGLSQGQRQLISIARAAVSDPPVMILDEATSSIDTRTEALVQEGMDNLMKGRTVFVIAHRLSTIKNSDVVMVMDQGRIIERGSHDELMAKGGVYYRLYTGGLELD
jgi:ATP-binding cassette subfamily B multidrug efflux pump